HIETRVGCDAIQPRAKRSTSFEAFSVLPRSRERLLHRVFGIVQGAEHAVTVDQQLAPVLFCESVEAELVSRANSRRGRCALVRPCHSHALRHAWLLGWFVKVHIRPNESAKLIARASAETDHPRGDSNPRRRSGVPLPGDQRPPPGLIFQETQKS